MTANPEGRQGDIVSPPSVLAPETALGSRPRVALPSAQVMVILRWASLLCKKRVSVGARGGSSGGLREPASELS